MEDVKSQEIFTPLANTTNNVQVAEIMDLTKLASTFPEIEKPSIRRENIIMTLTEMLCSDTEVVIVDGPDGIGKTTLLAQFAREYSNNCFSLFVRSCSRYAYDSGMLMRDLCDQIGWVIKKENYRVERESDPTQLLNTRIFELQRKANYERSMYYFIVDGLEEIPQEDYQERDMILNLLPFGMPRFRFILSGSLELLKNRSSKIRGISPFRLVKFTFEETRQFFSGLVDEYSQLETIHKICNMVPGKLASVRRLLQAGIPIEQLLDEIPDNPPDWFELEWRVVGTEDNQLRQALAIIAFDRRCHSVASLAKLCKIDPAEIDKKLASCNFVERRNDGQIVEFVNDVFKRFAAKQLTALKRSVLDMVISDLFDTPESADALTHLPGFLNQAERYEELLNYLSPVHIGKLIDCGDSWIPLHQKADLGVDTALRLGRDGDLLRFGLQRSTIASIESAESWRSEIEAYVALDDFSAAYALVQRMVTKEDRLQLLSVITRAKKIKKLPIEVELHEQIEQLYHMIDRTSLGERGIAIASDLLYTHPELAIELVQECANKDRVEDSIDISLAKLSFKALVEKVDGAVGMESAQETLRAKVKDPQIQKFINTISIFFGGYNAERVIADVDKWEKAADRIFALRAWAVTNAKQQDAAIVIEYALNTILKTTTYTANAKVYQELALPLIHIPDLNRVKTIISKFDGFKGLIETTGPTVEYIKLQCTLAEAEARYDRDAASDRLLDIFIFVDALTDPSPKLTAFALLSRALKIIDEHKQFEANSGIHAAVLDGLRIVIDEILMKTADHYKAIRPAIAALARTDKNISFEVINRLNTLPRRDAALVRFIESVAVDVPSKENIAALIEAYGRIQFVSMRTEATHVAIRGLLRRKKDLSSFIDDIIALRKWVTDIPDAEEKCKVICMYFDILIEHNNAIPNLLRDSLVKELGDTWDKVDAGWSKVEVGFKIVSMLAKCSPDISRDFLVRTMKARNEIILDSSDMATSYISCVQLTVRCFGGLIKRKLYSAGNFDELQQLISDIPSISVRAIAFCDLSLKFFMAHDVERCQKIVSEQVRPIIDSDTIGDEVIRWQTITAVALTLYCAHHGSAIQLLEGLPMPYKDLAYFDICSFLITNELPSELYDPSSKPNFKVDYNNFLDIYEILQRIEADNAIYFFLKHLVDNIQRRLRNDFNKAQVADILLKLRNLIKTKFPNPEYIKHEGYKILGEAQIARLERDKNPWEALSLRARAIPNIADRAFVLMGIGAAMPAKESTKTIALFKEAKALIAQMSIVEDRCEHYEDLAKVCADIDKSLSKDCLRQAWKETMPIDVTEIPKSRRRIIDFAHRIDPEFASSLASETDNDPGRDFARQQAKQRIELLKRRERAASGENDALKPEQNGENHMEFAKMMLAGLNSNRINPIHIDFTRQHIKQASRMNLQDAYVVISWVIENALRRYSDTDQAYTFLRPLYEASRLSSELAFRIAVRIRTLTDSGISSARNADASGTNLIHSGERDKALAILREFVSNASSFIKVTDPYFGLEELELVKLIRGVNLTIPIFVLTSRKHQQDTRIQQPWDDTYQSYWRMTVSDADPGEVTLIMIGKSPTGEHPIHDRWWLSENGGLRIGTSVNSLGFGRISEVSQISATDSGQLLAEVDQYITGQVLVQNGKIYRLSSFRL